MSLTRRILVIGASAGGVEALLRIAPRLAENLAAPILLVLHIGAHRSHMPELLNAKGTNRAVFAKSGVAPQPGMIYVAPPDQHLLLEAGMLRLFRGPKEHHARPAVDPLFRSAALDRGPHVVGVILTGMLDDGSAGLRAIKACGGIAVVQDPEDAAEPSMPRSALAAAAVDHIVRLDAMAELLNTLAQPLHQAAPMTTPPDWLRIEHAISLGLADLRDIEAIGVPSRFTCPDCGGTLFEIEKDGPLRFLCHTGHAFSLRTLAVAHEQVTDEALWTVLRALQAKEAILRRLAEQQARSAPGSEAETLADARRVEAFMERMREVVTRAPPAASGGDAAETSE